MACDIFYSTDGGSVLRRRKFEDDVPSIITLRVPLRAAVFIQLPLTENAADEWELVAHRAAINVVVQTSQQNEV